MEMRTFRKRIWDHYRANRREFPWRDTTDPYRIFVSEVMLQQTQAPRVVPKYRSFLKRFPSFKALAAAPLRDVLAEWKGLGYNRRALNLKRAAEIIMADYGGRLPKTPDELDKLPGIGANTAGSIAAFAWNAPVAFIETNVRSVFIHFFFEGRDKVSDAELLPLVEKALDRSNPREWYFALMDYGVSLKKTGNPNVRSRHYSKQSPFRGSRRELRAKLLSLAVENTRLTVEFAASHAHTTPAVAASVLDELSREGMLKGGKGVYSVG